MGGVSHDRIARIGRSFSIVIKLKLPHMMECLMIRLYRDSDALAALHAQGGKGSSDKPDRLTLALGTSITVSRPPERAPPFLVSYPPSSIEHGSARVKSLPANPDIAEGKRAGCETRTRTSSSRTGSQADRRAQPFATFDCGVEEAVTAWQARKDRVPFFSASGCGTCMSARRTLGEGGLSLVE